MTGASPQSGGNSAWERLAPLLRFSKVRKEISWTALAKGAAISLFILFNILLARRLGVEVYGRWSYFLDAFNLILLFSALGINSASRVYMARCSAEGALASGIQAAVLLRTCGTLIAAALLAFLAPRLAELLERPSFVSLFRWAALLLVAQGFADFLKATFEGLHRNSFTFAVTLMEHAGKLLLVLCLVFEGASLLLVLWCCLGASGAAALTGLAFLYLFFYRQSQAAGRPNLAPAVARYALQLFLVSVGASLFLYLDTVLLGLWGSDSAVGLFAPAKQISQRLFHVGAIVAAGALPLFANMDPARKPYLRQLLRKLLLLTMGILGSAGLALLIGADFLVVLLFGEEYRAAAGPMRLLVPFMLELGASAILQGILDYRGLALLRALFLAVCVVCQFVLCALLIPRFGAMGAAASTSLSFLPYVVFSYIAVRRNLADDQDTMAGHASA